MRSAELEKVGKKIREIRKHRKMNLQEVAQKSSITAGLLSRIENFKTLPSLPVLHKISMALEVPLSDLVQSVGPPINTGHSLIKNGSVPEEKDGKGWIHQHLIHAGFLDATIKVKKLIIPSGLHPYLKTADQMLLFFLLKGTLHFHMGQEKIPVEQGDILWVEGKTIMALENKASDSVHIFKVLLSKS